MPLADAHSWFVVCPVEPGIWLIGEPPHVNSWLVVGRERAALIDTGLGVASMRAAAAALTELPIVVTNTHAHFDHVGSNYEFDEILIHERGAYVLEQGVPGELLRGYLGYVDELEAALTAYLRADERFFFNFVEADRPRPFPAHARTGGWQIPASRATGTLVDGDRIDLGGRELTVVATPGHSPDHVSFVLEREGVLFAGDAVSTGAIYAQWPESELSSFAHSAERLAALASQLRIVYVHHFLRSSAAPALLEAVARGFHDLLVGEASFRPNRDCAGQRVREAVFPGFSIFVPSRDEAGDMSTINTLGR